jgi:succinoglycan biosynthesis transport protein ExoP
MVAVAWETAPSLRDRLQALRRRRRELLVVLVAGATLTFALALFWPPTYRATATILIEQQEIPQDLVRSTISSYADQRVQVISQRVMTSQNLTKIVEQYNLYPWQRRTRAREVVIERMRDDIKMRMISANVMDPRSGRPMQATIAFTVSYDSGSPDLALKVANELTSLYLNENLTIRTEAARQTSGFLGAEADRLRDDIQVLAAKISVFKEGHVNELPDLAQSNFQLADRTELDLREARNRLGTLDEQKVLLQAQLFQIAPTAQMYSETGQRIFSPADRLKVLKSEAADLRSKYGPDHPDLKTAEREIAGLQAEVSADGSANDVLRRLDEARAQLAAARERYSADHPDVQRLTRTVDNLEREARDLPASERVRAARTNPDNPAYIQVKAQLDAVLTERAAAERRIRELEGRRDDFERRLAKAPAVEREYRALTREYENVQLKYQEVRTKQREAEAAQDLESQRKGERFTLIEPPLPPEQPVSPNRPLVLVLGLLLSGGLALLVMSVLDAVDTSIRGATDLTRLVEVAPLAAIPMIPTEDERARQDRARRRRWVAIAGAVLAAVLVVHLFVRPLDVLWLALARRLGL